MTKDEALSKIRKLLAVAQDGRGNMNEAESAMRMATALMRKFQIESADEVMKDLKNGIDMVTDTDSIWAYPSKNIPKKCPTWVGVISLGVGLLNDVITTISYDSKAGVVVKFAGYGPDVQFAKWLYRFLIETTYRLSTEHATERGERESFRYGMAGVLQARMRSMKEEQEAADKQEAASGSSCTALVLVDTKKNAVALAFGQQTTKSGAKREYNDSMSAGRSAGQKLNIPRNNPLGSNSGNSTLLK